MVLFAIKTQAQLVQGDLKCKEKSKVELEIKGNKAVNLYAAFCENNYPIHFVFTGIDIPLNTEKKEVVISKLPTDRLTLRMYDTNIVTVLRAMARVAKRNIVFSSSIQGVGGNDKDKAI